MSFQDHFKAVEGSNEWLKIVFAPEIGGRIIQLSLEGYDFLFNNKSSVFSENYREKAVNGQWVNYGGEKLWPAPQGWGKKTHWPGPPDVVLDGGIFTLQQAGNQFHLESEVDPYTGLKVARTVVVNERNTIVQVNCVFENKSEEVKEWAIWPVAQLHAQNFENHCYELVLPLASKSHCPTGYQVVHGLVNNPQIKVQEQQLSVQFQYLVGKINSDSNQGWVAYINRSNGKVYVNFFEPEMAGNYPDNSTVQIWTQGRGMIYSRETVKEFPNDVNQNPPYLEIELLSPLKPIQPQQKVMFSYQIGLSTISPIDPIQHIDQNRITCIPLKFSAEGEFLWIEASYGFFEEKNIQLNVIDEKTGKTYHQEQFKVNPNSPLKLSRQIEIGEFKVENLSVKLTETKESNKEVD